MSQHEQLENFLQCAAMNYFVLEIGRLPQKPRNLCRAPDPALKSSKEGREVNAYLTNSVKCFTSRDWSGRVRQEIASHLQACRYGQFMFIGKNNVAGKRSAGLKKNNGALQLHLLKTDRTWEKVQAKWTDKCGRYRAMLKHLADLHLLQGPEYDYLRLEDLAAMEAKVLPQGPLRGCKFVLEGTFLSSPRQALCEEIVRYGGRIIGLEEIDGSDVIIVLGESDGNFVPPIAHYWGT